MPRDEWNPYVEWPPKEGWRTIDSAPKDRPVLLAGQWLSGVWDIQIGQWLTTRWPIIGEGQPTLWMPLPEPPSKL